MAMMAERLRRWSTRRFNQALRHRAITLTEDELQRSIAPLFPVRVEGMVNVVLDQPQVRLDRGRDRIGLELSVTPEFLGEEAPATRWLIEGQVSYLRDTGEFFIHRPDLRLLPGDGRAPGALRQYLVGELIGSFIPALPLYQLKPGRFRQALVRRLLRSVHVADGKVMIYLQLEERP